MCSMIKVSVCYCLLGIRMSPSITLLWPCSLILLSIVPETYRRLRLAVRCLAVAIMGLGIAECLIWVFQCQPFLSNFIYSVDANWCADVDAARYGMLPPKNKFHFLMSQNADKRNSLGRIQRHVRCCSHLHPLHDPQDGATRGA